MSTILDIGKASPFFDGQMETPVRLAHPEGVAIHEDGSVWCGTENGHIIAIEADGSAMSVVAETGGFIAGIAFDGKGGLFACDIHHGRMFRLDIASGSMTLYGKHHFAVPNYPVVDLATNSLFVSDSHGFDEALPAIYRADLDGGEFELWCDRPFFFANGMALHPHKRELYVVESKRQAIVAIEILEDGTAGSDKVIVDGVKEFPDGIAFDDQDRLFIGCYEPSLIYVFDEKDGLREYIRDREATVIAHPTNLAFRGNELFTANLGRWHITRIETDSRGAPVLRN